MQFHHFCAYDYHKYGYINFNPCTFCLKSKHHRLQFWTLPYTFQKRPIWEVDTVSSHLLLQVLTAMKTYEETKPQKFSNILKSTVINKNPVSTNIIKNPSSPSLYPEALRVGNDLSQEKVCLLELVKKPIKNYISATYHYRSVQTKKNSQEANQKLYFSYISL